jgi:hypothetical protein
MEYFWKENKRFVVAVAGGLLFAMLYHSFVVSPLRKGEGVALQTRDRERKALEARMGNGVPSAELLADLQRDCDLKRKALATVVADVSFKVGDAFKAPSKGGAKERYDQVKVDLDKELRSKASGKMEMPKLIGIETDAADETAPELLLRLSVVERLVDLALAAKVEKVEVVDALSGMGSGEPRKGVFLATYPVFMKFRGTEQAVFGMLHAVQKKGQFLAVTQFHAQKEDLGKDVVGGSIGVALLSVDEKATIDGKSPEKTE